jgi:hypothetical protein
LIVGRAQLYVRIDLTAGERRLLIFFFKKKKKRKGRKNKDWSLYGKQNGFEADHCLLRWNVDGFSRCEGVSILSQSN